MIYEKILFMNSKLFLRQSNVQMEGQSSTISRGVEIERPRKVDAPT